MQTPILVEKSPNNVPKLSLNMPPQLDIQIFPFEAPFVLWLIQLWLEKHQLNCMIIGVEEGRHFDVKSFNNCMLVNWRVHVPLERSRCHINQLFDMKNVFIKVNFTILKCDCVSYVHSFPKNYYKESHDQILNLRDPTSTSKFE